MSERPDPGPEDRGGVRHHRAVFNFLAGNGMRAVTVLYMVLSVPLLVNGLGRERYGVLAVLASMLTYLQLLNLGVGYSLVNAVAGSRGRAEPSLRDLVSSALLPTIPLVALCGLVTWWAVPLLPLEGIFPSTDVAIHEEARQTVRLVVLMGLALVLFALVNAAQRAFQEDFFGNFWAAAGRILQLAVVWIALRQGEGLVAIFGGFLAVTVLVQTLNAVFFFRRHPECRPAVSHIRPDLVKILFGQGLLFLCLDFSGILESQLDNLIISSRLGPGEVASYSLVLQIVVYGFSLVDGISFAYWVPYAEALARGEHDWVARTFSRVVAASFSAATLLAVLMSCFGEDLLFLWVGPAVRFDPWIIRGLSLLLMLHVLLNANGVMLNAMGRMKQGLVIALSTGFLKVAVSLWLIEELGARGVVLGALLPGALLNLPVSSAMVHRLSGQAIRFPALSLIRAGILPGILTLWLGFQLAEAMAGMSPLGRMLAGSAAVTLAFAGLAALVSGLRPSDFRPGVGTGS